MISTSNSSQDRLETSREELLRFMPNPFFAVDAEWTLEYANPAAAETLGIPAEKIIGQNLWKAFPGLVGSDFEKAYRKAMTERVRTEVVSYYEPFDRWYAIWAYPLKRGIAISFTDVTEKRLAETRFLSEKLKFEAIFYGSASPLVFFRGKDLVYEAANAKYEALVPKRELIGKPLLQALPELEGTPFPALIRRTLETGEPTLTLEEYAPLRDPETGRIVERYFDTAISRVEGVPGQEAGVFVQVTETTERVHARRQMEQALTSRDTFLSVASHELRTPLTGLRLQTQIIQRLLQKTPSPEQLYERLPKLLAKADSALERMGRLIEDMLDIGRIQSGRLTLQREPRDLRSFVTETIDHLSEELAHAGIALSIEEFEGALPVSIDPFRMEQVITNLVTNAIRYAPKAPIRVTFDRDPKKCRMVFADEGPGVDPSDFERIFERFERADATNIASGLGLGLFIVRQIVLAHGGSIRVEAGPARGARFILELPLAEAR